MAKIIEKRQKSSEIDRCLPEFHTNYSEFRILRKKFGHFQQFSVIFANFLAYGILDPKFRKKKFRKNYEHLGEIVRA